MDYDYSNMILDKKLDKLKQYNYEIERMIQSVENESPSNDSSSFYSDSSEKSEGIRIRPGFFDNHNNDSYRDPIMDQKYTSASSFDDEDEYMRRDDRRIFLRDHYPQSNKAKVSFRMSRSMINRPPRPAIPRYVQPRPINTLQKDFQIKIKNETAEFMNRCFSAPLRSYGSVNDLGSFTKPPKSSTGPRFSKRKISPKPVISSREKNFTNLNKWVPNGKIKHPLAASLNNLSDVKISIEKEKKGPKNEILRQKVISWKPNGKIRVMSATRESRNSLKDSKNEINVKLEKQKEIENKVKEMEKGWKPNGKAKETPYPKQTENLSEKDKDDLNKKEDPRIKELEKKWKPNGKVEQPFVPYKSVDIKTDASKVDEKKEAEIKKVKELESKWKPGTKSRTTESLKTETVLTDKPPPKPFAKTFPQSKVDSKPPIASKPKANVASKTPIKNFIEKNKVAIKKPTKQNTSNSDHPLNSTPTKEPKPFKALINDSGNIYKHSTINDSNLKDDLDELEKKADSEFENDIKNEGIISNNSNNRNPYTQTSTPKIQKSIKSPETTDSKSTSDDKIKSQDSSKLSNKKVNNSKPEKTEQKSLIEAKPNLDESIKIIDASDELNDDDNNKPSNVLQKNNENKSTIKNNQSDESNSSNEESDENTVNKNGATLKPNDIFSKLKSTLQAGKSPMETIKPSGAKKETNKNDDDTDSDKSSKNEIPNKISRAEDNLNVEGEKSDLKTNDLFSKLKDTLKPKIDAKSPMAPVKPTETKHESKNDDSDDEDDSDDSTQMNIFKSKSTDPNKAELKNNGININETNNDKSTAENKSNVRSENDDEDENLSDASDSDAEEDEQQLWKRVEDDDE